MVMKKRHELSLDQGVSIDIMQLVFYGKQFVLILNEEAEGNARTYVNEDV